MKCLFGVYKEDSGSILIDGVETHFAGPKNALDNGVAMVHQELNQVLNCLLYTSDAADEL